MISIIIPTYNEEKYIGKNLLRLKEKMALPHEVIVCDDKSTDRTVEIARECGAVVVLAETKHPTIAANRNNGVRSAHGDMYAFMDADSYIDDPDAFFKRALGDFESDPNLVALTGKLQIFPEVETWSDVVMYKIFNFVHRIKNNVLHSGESSGKFQMMRKSAFDKVGGFPAHLVTREDGVMFNKLAKIGRTMYDPELVIFHNGRRAHAIGWPRLLSIWMIESFWVAAFGKALSKSWKEVR